MTIILSASSARKSNRAVALVGGLFGIPPRFNLVALRIPGPQHGLESEGGKTNRSDDARQSEAATK